MFVVALCLFFISLGGDMLMLPPSDVVWSRLVL